jgi:hypothetical protein
MTRPDLSLDVITIFPDYLAPLRQSLLGKAIERGQVELRAATSGAAQPGGTTVHPAHRRGAGR